MNRNIILTATCWLMLSTLNIVFAQENITKRIDSVMNVAANRGIFNGNIVVNSHGRTVYSSSIGYADPVERTKLNAGMLFDIGSVSKEFNGVAIMICKEHNQLNLDDPLSKFIDSLPDWSKKVKVKNLINYTSGIPLFDPLALETEQTVWRNLKGLQNLSFEPGTGYIYNHYNVFLQMRIIEKVSGMRYADFINKYIFKVLGMNSTIVDYPPNGKKMAKAFDLAGQPTPYLQGMSGWVRLSTADLCKWVAAVDDFKLINEESYRSLALNFPGGESSLGTVGFEGDKLSWHQHQGSNSNFEALIYHSLKDQLIIVMTTNQQQMKVHGLKSAIISSFDHWPVIVPKRSVYLAVREKVLSDFNGGMAYYDQLKAAQQENFDFSFETGDLISIGKYLQRRGRHKDARTVFEKAVSIPASGKDLSYGYELMAGASVKLGERSKAIAFYQKAVELDSENKNAANELASLQKKE